MIKTNRKIGTASEKYTSGNNLIFLISQPRSGSTLLQVLLAGSSDIATSSEPWIALHPVFAMRKHGLQSVYNAEIANSALADFLKQIGAGKDFFNKQVGTYLDSFYRKAIAKQDKIYFLDKTPRYYHIVDDLAQIFPAAKFIILFRNPLSVLHSIIKTWVKEDFASIVNFIEDLWIAPLNLIHFVKEHPEKSVRVKYEDLVSDPPSVLKDICRFIGIEFTNNMLAYGKRVDPSWNLGDKAVLHKEASPVPNSINRWKQGFDTPESASFAISYLESLGPDVVSELGYDYCQIKKSIQIPSGCRPKETPSFPEVKDIVEGLPEIKELKKEAFIALAEDKKLQRNNKAKPLQDSDLSKPPGEQSLPLKLTYLRKEIHELRVRNSRLHSEIDRMRNTLSWKATAPLRNSKFLDKIFTLFTTK
jgi:hypothetical protein